MSKYPIRQVVIQQPASTSGLAIAGLVFSILGWFTCGLLCIPDAFFCLLALFSRGPKGTALAGLIVGFPGTLFFAFVGFGMIMGLLGLGAVTTSPVREVERAQSQVQRQSPVVPPVSTAAKTAPASKHPMVDEPAAVPDAAAAIDAAKWRTWTTADGKHKIEAKFVKAIAGTVTLEKKDSSTVDVKLSILCSDDQDFVKQRKWTQATPSK